MRTEFQLGLCLLAGTEGGYHYMRAYDNLPKRVRKRLCASPFNLCPACVSEGGTKYFRTIKRMEKMIRDSNAPERGTNDVDI